MNINRKEIILNSAITLFAQSGFASVSTSAVAKHAGVAEGLIFHYFNTKEDILLCILEQVSEKYLDGFKARKADCSTGIEVVRAFIEYNADFHQEYSDALLILFRDLPSSFLQEGNPHYEALRRGLNEIIGLLEEGVGQGKKDGTIRDVSEHETALLIWGMVHGSTRLELLEPIDVPDLTDLSVDFCIKAIEKK